MDYVARLVCCAGTGRPSDLSLSVLRFFCAHCQEILKNQAMQTLQGTWQFIGKEIYLPPQNKWIDQQEFPKGVSWCFSPKYIIEGCEYGTVTELSSQGGFSDMKYIYHINNNQLIVDEEIQDIYKVLFSPWGTVENPVIRLDILTDEFPSPYLRYILRKI